MGFLASRCLASNRFSCLGVQTYMRNTTVKSARIIRNKCKNARTRSAATGIQARVAAAAVACAPIRLARARGPAPGARSSRAETPRRPAHAGRKARVRPRLLCRLAGLSRAREEGAAVSAPDLAAADVSPQSPRRPGQPRL